MRKMGIGLQLYTLRSETAADFAGTLRRVAELGYEGVEFAGYGGMPPEELGALLKELNLKAIGAHVGLKNLRENLQGEIDYLRAIGGTYLICPSLPKEEREDEEAWKRLFAFFEQAGAEARKQGLVFAYHNHAFEFEQRVGDEFAFDALYSHTRPSSVQVEMDVCWVQFAGQDPLRYIARYNGRLPLLHLKDFSKDEQGKMQTLELGQGVVQLPQVIEAASDAGVEWLIVEQDHCQNPPLQSVSNSYDWVKKHYLERLSNETAK